MILKKVASQKKKKKRKMKGKEKESVVYGIALD